MVLNNNSSFLYKFSADFERADFFFFRDEQFRNTDRMKILEALWLFERRRYIFYYSGVLQLVLNFS